MGTSFSRRYLESLIGFRQAPRNPGQARGAVGYTLRRRYLASLLGVVLPLNPARSLYYPKSYYYPDSVSRPANRAYNRSHGFVHALFSGASIVVFIFAFFVGGFIALAIYLLDHVPPGSLSC